MDTIKSLLNGIISAVTGALFPELKKMVAGLIVAAENSLEGSTGAEKRAYVVSQLDEAVTLPTLLEGLDNLLFGYLVDVICDALNILTDYDIADASDEEIEAAAAVALEASTEELEEIAETTETIDERLQALYKKYGVIEEEVDSE